jgi:structural maintenance of chromosome 1
VDRISGSADLKDEYNQAKNSMDKAVESSTFNYNKRRGINSELKQFKEQKSEAERYEKLLDEKVSKSYNRYALAIILTSLI